MTTGKPSQKAKTKRQEKQCSLHSSWFKEATMKIRKYFGSKDRENTTYQPLWVRLQLLQRQKDWQPVSYKLYPQEVRKRTETQTQGKEKEGSKGRKAGLLNSWLSVRSPGPYRHPAWLGKDEAWEDSLAVKTAEMGRSSVWPVG